MADVFDYSKEYNDYKQRIALVYKALFENEFLENFYVIMQELFNGNYLLSDLRKAVEKSRKGLFDGKTLAKPILKKENTSNFTNSVEKTLALLFLLGEVCFEIKNNMDDEEFDLYKNLTILSDTIITIESERSVYLSALNESSMKTRDVEHIRVHLIEMDNIFVKKCKNVEKYLRDKMPTLDIKRESEKEISKDIVNVISSIVRVRELERKFLRKDDMRMM